MKHHTFIAFGGCHISGYGAGNASSFVNYFSRDAKLKCINTTANFQIKRIQQVTNQIEQYNPGIILLQLGNHEFHASLKKLFQNKKVGKPNTSADSSADTSPNSTNASATIRMLPVAKEINSISFLRIFFTHLIWNVIIKRHIKYLSQMKEIIAANPHKKFIVLSPMLCMSLIWR